MALSIADQIALDDALVAPADRLKIGKCNLRLSSDVTSKEATLQVVYDSWTSDALQSPSYSKSNDFVSKLTADTIVSMTFSLPKLVDIEKVGTQLPSSDH
ncbi:hypothetical protein Tco_0963676 [Tanacetum coccineum]